MLELRVLRRVDAASLPPLRRLCERQSRNKPRGERTEIRHATLDERVSTFAASRSREREPR